MRYKTNRTRAREHTVLHVTELELKANTVVRPFFVFRLSLMSNPAAASQYLNQRRNNASFLAFPSPSYISFVGNLLFFIIHCRHVLRVLQYRL